jgi:hypothetical protein
MAPCFNAASFAAAMAALLVISIPVPARCGCGAFLKNYDTGLDKTPRWIVYGVKEEFLWTEPNN